MTPRPAPTIRVIGIGMADGTDPNSPEAQRRIARALLRPGNTTDTARPSVQQAAEKRPA